VKVGAVKLKKYILESKEKNKTIDSIAKSIGCSRSYLLELASGKKNAPSIDMANRIQTMTRIKISDWSKDEKVTEGI